ncbi:hypothetical protein KIN20_000223 [Parelaphostrongylus tenuis]|uniref:Uncharacterized protein n=1 Tax=Parelaphostrongylus tenuis TaxID=148309 RepID=A0AAD5LS60_PARTN|nr:hypothetical protein KIN20_000223 [Parelaphostrongylus tenuis]
MTGRLRISRTEDYELLVRGLKRYADLASHTQPRRADRISMTTLLEKRRKLKLNSNAAHLARLISNISCRRTLQEDLYRYRRKKLSGAAQESSSTKKCRWNLCDYSVQLSSLMNEDGVTKASSHDMELITEKICTNLFHFTSPVSDPVFSTGEKLPGILPSKVELGRRRKAEWAAFGPLKKATD